MVGSIGRKIPAIPNTTQTQPDRARKILVAIMPEVYLYQIEMVVISNKTESQSLSCCSLYTEHRWCLPVPPAQAVRAILCRAGEQLS